MLGGDRQKLLLYTLIYIEISSLGHKRVILFDCYFTPPPKPPPSPAPGGLSGQLRPGGVRRSGGGGVSAVPGAVWSLCPQGGGAAARKSPHNTHPHTTHLTHPPPHTPPTSLLLWSIYNAPLISLTDQVRLPCSSLSPGVCGVPVAAVGPAGQLGRPHGVHQWLVHPPHHQRRLHHHRELHQDRHRVQGVTPADMER